MGYYPANCVYCVCVYVLAWHNVWGGIVRNTLIGLFISGNSTAEMFLHLLQDQFVSSIINTIGSTFQHTVRPIGWFPNR